jgi:hypothetical protein
VEIVVATGEAIQNQFDALFIDWITFADFP